MAMTAFEKALIGELQGIRKELHELNKKKPEPGQLDGQKIHIEMDPYVDAKRLAEEVNSSVQLMNGIERK